MVVRLRRITVGVAVSTGVNSQGQREILGMDVGASEDGALWLAFLRSLNATCLSRVGLVVSDAHRGDSTGFEERHRHPPEADRTHFMINLLTRVPRRSQPGVATMVLTIYKQLSPEEVHAQADRVIVQLQEHFLHAASASGGLADALPDLLAFTVFPASHWQKLWSNTRWSD